MVISDNHWNQLSNGNFVMQLLFYGISCVNTCDFNKMFAHSEQKPMTVIDDVFQNAAKYSFCSNTTFFKLCCF